MLSGMLKDRFITQSTSGIRRELQKLTLGPNIQLGELLKIATSVFYNWDKEEEEKGRKRKWKKEKD